jgi:glycosyltransferase involved in cell wall biosynthesis
MAHLNFLVLLLRPFYPRNTQVLIRQNVTVSAALDHFNPPFWTRLCYQLLYPHADRIICQSQAMAADLVRELGLSPALIAVLPNPVDIAAIHAAAASPEPWPGPGPHLLAIGRLSPEKGFDLLLQSLVLVRAVFPTASLTILGVGSQESALKSLAESLGLAEAVRFAGRVDPPYRYYPGATLFVLSSRHDAMPNALLEAAAAGLPIVATPASGGLADLLRNHNGAWLASNVTASALAAALVSALETLHSGQRFDHAFPPDSTP